VALILIGCALLFFWHRSEKQFAASTIANPRTV
jgi:hypothetical protein